MTSLSGTSLIFQLILLTLATLTSPLSFAQDNAEVQQYIQQRQQYSDQVDQKLIEQQQQQLQQFQKMAEGIKQFYNKIGVSDEDLKSFSGKISDILTERQKFVFDLISDPEITEPLTRIIERGKLKVFSMFQLTLLVIMMLSRSVLLSKSRSIVKSIGISLWLFCLYWTLAVLVIPYVLYKKDYLNLLGGLWKHLKPVLAGLF